MNISFFHKAFLKDDGFKMIWRNMPAIPRVGDHIHTSEGKWEVLEVIWTGANADFPGSFEYVKVVVLDCQHQYQS